MTKTQTMLIQFLWNLLTKIVVNSLDKIEELEMENYTFFIYSKDVDNVHYHILRV